MLALFTALPVAPPVRAQAPSPSGSPFLLSTSATVDPDVPALGMSASGAFLAVWTDAGADAQDYKLFGRRSPGSGLPLDAEFRVNTTRPGFQYSPAVGMSPDGAAVVIWTSSDAGGRSLFAQRYDAAGAAVGAFFKVTSDAVVNRRYPAVARSAAGTTAVVWQGTVQSASGEDIFIQTFTAADAPIGGEARVNTSTPGSQAFPDVAADAAGNALVVWGSPGGGGGVGLGIFGQRVSATAAPVGTEFQINTTTSGIPQRPAVAVSASGAALVVWEVQTTTSSTTTYRVFGRRYDASGAAVGVEFPISDPSELTPVRPAVSMDPAGDAVVVWSAPDPVSGASRIYGQRYAPDGAAVGGVFPAGPITAVQTTPGVAMDADGDFAVIWMAEVPGSAIPYAVVGQRFNRAGVADEAGADAAGLALALAPNPTTGTTVVRYETAAAQRVRVTVVDVLGRPVAVLADGEQAAGPHEVRLDTARLAPGVYVVRLDAGVGALARRITVAR